MRQRNFSTPPFLFRLFPRGNREMRARPNRRAAIAADSKRSARAQVGLQTAAISAQPMELSEDFDWKTLAAATLVDQQVGNVLVEGRRDRPDTGKHVGDAREARAERLRLDLRRQRIDPARGRGEQLSGRARLAQLRPILLWGLRHRERLSDLGRSRDV